MPFEAFIPQSVDGLIAAEKNLSVTRLVNGAIRLQPITMLTGQAAGVIAALAVQQGVQPRSVNPFEVQKYLVDHGCRLTVQTFADVPRSHPSWEAVQLVAAREIMIGYSDVDFAITDEQERGWAAAIIARMFDVNSSNPPAVPTFQDVPTDHPAYAWIEGLAAAGLTSGCSAVPKLYCPDDPLTRAALAAFIVNGMGWNVDNAPVQPYYQDLPDAAAHWSFAFVQLVSQHGLKFGCSNNTFCPDEPISRGDIADVVLDILLLLN